MTTQGNPARHPAGMTHAEIRDMLGRNADRAMEIHEKAVARKATEIAALISQPQETPKPTRTLSRPRVGHRMRELQAIVSAMPGISKSDALRAAGLPVHGMGSGRELNRAINAGLILVEHPRSNLTRLFASEGDRKRWHLTREALTPGTPAQRVAELVAEIAALDEQRAATWV